MRHKLQPLIRSDIYLARANAKLRRILRRRTREIAGDSKSARKQRSCGGVAPPFFCKAKGLSKLKFAEGTFAIQILLYVRERPGTCRTHRTAPIGSYSVG
jgi:hypothetical protein